MRAHVQLCSNVNYLHFSLEESGLTALGPALLLSISLAARVPGSKVREINFLESR